MANIIKQMRKRKRRRKMIAEKKRMQESQGRSGNRSAGSSKGGGKKILLLVILVLGIVLAWFYFQKHSYKDYKVIQTSEQEDIISTSYVEMDGNILRYSSDGASLVDKKLDTIWSETYEMQNPMADVCGKRAVIADRDGNEMVLYNENGRTGAATASYSIVKARVSRNGLVAAILDGGDATWINLYNTDGTLIAENQTNLEDPGFPMDVALSDSGEVMMVTYQFVDGNKTTSYVAFYNFGDVGQNEDDRIVSGYTYKGVVIPQIEYLENGEAAALRDDGFTLYKGTQIPKEALTVEADGEIVSTFCDDETIGIVYKNDDSDKLYTMKVYNLAGKLKFQKDFNVQYTTIKISREEILMYNSSQICVLNEKGVERYFDTVNGTIRNFFKIGWNKYLLVLDTGVNVISFT